MAEYREESTAFEFASKSELLACFEKLGLTEDDIYTDMDLKFAGIRKTYKALRSITLSDLMTLTEDNINDYLEYSNVVELDLLRYMHKTLCLRLMHIAITASSFSHSDSFSFNRERRKIALPFRSKLFDKIHDYINTPIPEGLNSTEVYKFLTAKSNECFLVDDCLIGEAERVAVLDDLLEASKTQPLSFFRAKNTSLKFWAVDEKVASSILGEAYKKHLEHFRQQMDDQTVFFADLNYYFQIAYVSVGEHGFLPFFYNIFRCVEAQETGGFESQIAFVFNPQLTCNILSDPMFVDYFIYKYFEDTKKNLLQYFPEQYGKMSPDYLKQLNKQLGDDFKALLEKTKGLCP